ncbi:MAG: 2OG-Fe(II) oxygenase [Variovorax sp.]
MDIPVYDERAAPAGVLVLEPEELRKEALTALATGKVLVLQVKGLIDAAICALIAARAEGFGYSPYLNVPSVRRIGMAFYETEGKAELIDEYFARARQHVSDFRRACLPYCSPIDTLRCMLDEAWPRGANLQTLEERKMFVGLSRLVQPGTTFLAHHDIFSEDAPGRIEATSLQAQFGANVYLQMPETGGALLMWNREIAPLQFNRMRGVDYGVPVESLGEPDLSLRPSPGDLLIFNSRKMHAVSPGTMRSRLAVSCFVGYRGEAEPLTFWS